MVIQCFTWSIIEQLLSSGNLGMGHARKINAFGEEIAEEAIRVFVGAALPGGVGMGEVDFEVEPSFDRLESCELRAVIASHRLACRFAHRDRAGHSRRPIDPHVGPGSYGSILRGCGAGCSTRDPLTGRARHPVSAADRRIHWLGLDG